MKIKHEGDGWIGSEDKRAILHKNVEIRAKWENVQMKGRNLELGVEVGSMMVFTGVLHTIFQN